MCMTKEQKNIAESLVARMKKDNKGSISWVKFQEQNKYTDNDMFIAVSALKDMNIIDYYPDKPSAIRFVAPNGHRFTTFMMLYIKRGLKIFIISILPILLSTASILWTMYIDSIKVDKPTESTTGKPRTNSSAQLTAPDTSKAHQK